MCKGHILCCWKVKEILEAPTSSNAKALSRFLGQIRCNSRMIRHLVDFATPLHAAVHRVTFQWAETRGEGLSGTRSNVVTSPGSSTSRLDEEFPCLRKCVGYSNPERPDATHRAEMVAAGVLLQPKAIKGGTKLLHGGEGNPRHGIQRNKIPTLLVG